MGMHNNKTIVRQAPPRVGFGWLQSIKFVGSVLIWVVSKGDFDHLLKVGRRPAGRRSTCRLEAYASYFSNDRNVIL